MTARLHSREPGKPLDPARCHAGKRLGNPAPDPGDRMCLSKFLVHLMRGKGMPQQELAEKTGLSPATISQIIRGDTSARAESLDRISQVLGLDETGLQKLHYYAASRAGFRLTLVVGRGW